MVIFASITNFGHFHYGQMFLLKMLSSSRSPNTASGLMISAELPWLAYFPLRFTGVLSTMLK